MRLRRRWWKMANNEREREENFNIRNIVGIEN